MPDEITREDVLDPQEAADFLHVDRMTIYRLIKAKKIRARRIGRQWRISKRILTEYLEGPPRPARGATAQ